MNTLHLKYAVEVEQTGSISKAAENLYMNQPHLSKTIRELEDSLGIVIFKRTPKGVIPTKKGTEFLIYAKKILAQLKEMESIYKPDTDKTQKLDISVPEPVTYRTPLLNSSVLLTMIRPSASTIWRQTP